MNAFAENEPVNPLRFIIHPSRAVPEDPGPPGWKLSWPSTCWRDRDAVPPGCVRVFAGVSRIFEGGAVGMGYVISVTKKLKKRSEKRSWMQLKSHRIAF